jgi:hypothetical protein
MESNLNLHPDAVKNFDQKAEELLSRLTPLAHEQEDEPPFKPDIFLAANITEKDMAGGIDILSRGKYYGHINESYFQHGDQFIGLAGADFRILQTLVESVQKTSSFRDHVSQDFILKKSLQWLRARHEETTNANFTGYIIEEARRSVAPVEIWIPIFGFYVQSDFPIGKVTIRTITKQMLDQMEEERKPVDPQASGLVEQVLKKRRKELQAAPAATISLLAEPIRAHEIAFEEAEKSLAVLRFFDPANYLPQVRSYWALLGLEKRATSTHLIVRNGRIVTRTDSALLKGRPGALLDGAAISTIRATGLDALGKILLKPEGDRDDFEAQLLGSILLYSKNALADDPSDRLIYIFAALESMLLKDRNEPIDKNVGERMAFLVGKTTAERQAVVRNTTETYRLRSSFLHHGQSIKELEIVAEFMRNAWSCFAALIRQVGTFRSRLQLIDALEERKMA